MNTKTKYWVYNVLDLLFTYGGTAGIVIYNCVSKNNSTGFKISFAGIVILICIIFFMKATFEKHYRQKYDTYLQQLAEANDTETKSKISEQLENHKTKNKVYQKAMTLLPFVIVYITTWLGSVALNDLRGTVGLIIVSLGGGAIFNILKAPVKEKLELEKITKGKSYE